MPSASTSRSPRRPSRTCSPRSRERRLARRASPQRLQRLLKVLRQRALGPDGHARERVDEGQQPCVEQRAPGGARRMPTSLPPVRRVTEDRVADVREMDADLVLAAGPQLDVEEGRAGEALDDPPTGEGGA